MNSLDFNQSDAEVLAELQASLLGGVTLEESYLRVADDVELRLLIIANPQEPRYPVLFIAGWISRMLGWKEVLKSMSDNFDVYYLETREKISSRTQGSVDQGVEAIANDIKVVIQKLGFRSGAYLLFGSSLGATAVLEACRDLETAPQALVLVGPNAEFRIPKPGLLVIYLFPPRLYSVIKPVVKWYLRTFRLNTEADLAQYQKYCSALDIADPWKLKKAALALAHYTVWDFLPEIQYPTLIIGGSNDNLHEPENLKKMTSMLPRAKYVDMGTNTRTHSPEMVEVLRGFLQDIQNKRL